MRQQVAENEIARESRKKRPRIIAFDARAGVLDEDSVAHARGAGGFAGATVQAFVDVVDEAGGDGKGLLLGVGDGGRFDADHLADASTGRVGLEVPQAVGGAGVEAQAAVDTARVVLVSGDEAGDWRGVSGAGCSGHDRLVTLEAAGWRR